MGQARKMLKVMSIILIIFGVFGVISLFTQNSVGDSALLLKCVSGACTIVSLIAGILGLIKSSSTEKATICVALGFLIIALSVASTIISMININTVIATIPDSTIQQLSQAGMTPEAIKSLLSNIAYGTTIVGLILNLILPILYIRGASKN